MVYTYTRKINRTKRGKKESNRKGKNTCFFKRFNFFLNALRAQAEFRGDKVAVCWYDQSDDTSS